MDRHSRTWLLLEAQHRYLKLPGRFTAVSVARRTGISTDRARRIFKGYPGAPVDRGELPPEAIIAAVAAAYQLAPRTLRDRLLFDAGRDDDNDLDCLEQAANILLNYVRKLRADTDPG